MRQLSIWIFILPALFAGRVAAQEWLPVHGGMLLGVGGIVLINGEADPRQFLVVHDVKGRKVYTAKITVAGGRLRYTPLDWIGFREEPRDLEALARVPGDDSFMALASKGIVYHIRIGQDEKGRERVEVLNEFWLPNPYNERNFEGLSLQVFDADVLAVWAWRGKNRTPARIYWGLLAPAHDKVSLQGSMPVKAPWPVVCRVPTGEECEIRHVSDLRVSAKSVLYIAAAADPGNDGPFDSAVYVAGRFHRKGNKFRLQLLSPLTEIRRFADSKVEAIEILRDHPRVMVFGSDDENQGGSIYVD